jgi:23S rRNA (guanosine2251-2'-O)-methyltransferase
VIRLRNPHAILAALELRPKDVRWIRLPDSASAASSEAWTRVLARAQTAGVEIRAKAGANRRSGPERARGSRDGESGRGTPAEAEIREPQPIAPGELLRGANGRAILALVGLRDPHNVGAIFRVAGFFGLPGIVLCGSPVPAGAACDIACGGVESVAFALSAFGAFAKAARAAGYRVVGTSEHARGALVAGGSVLLALGNEETGLGAFEKECDELAGIAPLGAVTSLNVSTAASVLVSQLVR